MKIHIRFEGNVTKTLEIDPEKCNFIKVGGEINSCTVIDVVLTKQEKERIKKALVETNEKLGESNADKIAQNEEILGKIDALDEEEPEVP